MVKHVVISIATVEDMIYQMCENSESCFGCAPVYGCYDDLKKDDLKKQRRHPFKTKTTSKSEDVLKNEAKLKK